MTIKANGKWRSDADTDNCASARCNYRMQRTTQKVQSAIKVRNSSKQGHKNSTRACDVLQDLEPNRNQVERYCGWLSCMRNNAGEFPGKCGMIVLLLKIN